MSRSDEAKTQQMDYEKMKEKLLSELKKSFRPEFLNRIDGVVVFHALTKEHIRKIVDLMLASVTHQLAEKGVKLEVTEAAKDFLGDKGYDEAFGARPLRRVIQDKVEDKLSDSLLRGEFRDRKDVFEVIAKLEEITPDIMDAIREIKGARSVEKKSEDSLAVECLEDLTPEIRRAILDNKGSLKGEMRIESFALAVVDVENGEIIIKSPGETSAHPAAVGALLADDKP
jgi:hypothetical protein